MITEAEHLQIIAAERAQHEAIVAAKDASLVKLQQRLDDLEEQLARFTRLFLGKSSERFAPIGDEVVSAQQFGLFGTILPDPEVLAEPAAPVTELSPKPSRKGRHPGRAPIPAHLPRRVEVIHPPGIECLVNAADGSVTYPGYTIIDVERSERVMFIPADLYVLQTNRPVLRKLTTGHITCAELPDRVLAKSVADETLAVELIIRKYIEHMPLYRQGKALERDYKWSVPEATLVHWVQSVATALRPLYDALWRRVLATSYLQMDETGILVLASPEANQDGGATTQPKPRSQKLKRGKTGKLEVPDAKRHLGYLWLARQPDTGLVIYIYDKSRSHALPKALLEDYRGWLQVDGWGAYRTALSKLHPTPKGERVGQYAEAPIRLVGCLAHIRRKFFDALDKNRTVATAALEQFQAMYVVEKAADELLLEHEARLAYRQVHLKPAFEAFGKWLEQYRNTEVPKGLMATAINYALAQWPLMQAVLEDGRIRLDNNGVENDVRPVAVGRKNYLFCGSHGAAQNAAVLYSLLASCKAVGVNPREWLNDTLRVLMGYNVSNIEELLPKRPNTIEIG